MLTKEITYVDDFSGEEVTETFYFALNSKSALNIIADAETTDLEAYLKEVIASRNSSKILAATEAIIREAVGERVGNRFVRSKEFKDWFVGSDAMGVLVVELMQDEEKAKKFFQSLLSEKQKQEAAKAHLEQVTK